jgi:hypothetical protein
MKSHSKTIPQPNLAVVLDPTIGTIRRREKTELFCCAVCPDDVDDIGSVTEASYIKDRIIGRHGKIPESKKADNGI